jgi:hypothetical protein
MSLLDRDTELKGAVGMPSSIHYLEFFRLFMSFLLVALEKETAGRTCTRSTHKTFEWYNKLMFAGDAYHAGVRFLGQVIPAEGLSSELDALLHAMEDVSVDAGTRNQVC